MKTTLKIIYLTFIPFCFGFITQSEYSFLYTVIINKEFVPNQTQTRICATIELVEEQNYLLPKKCFDNPTKNMGLKAALLRKKRLKFKPLIYEHFFLRWETFSEYAILEKNWEEGFIVATENIGSIRNFNSDNKTDDISRTNKTEIKKGSKVNGSKRGKRCMKTKTEFENVPASDHREKRFIEPQFYLPPVVEDPDKLPPRVLLSAPNNPLFTDCFILGWGTFFSNHSSLMQLEGLERRKNFVYSLRHEVEAYGRGNLYGELWFDRETSQEYVDDLGSPMICEVKGWKNLEVVIGMFMGGNSSKNHKSDTYRSFVGEFFYLTRWALGTNVSVTGDPSSWTLWPEEYVGQHKSKGAKLKCRFESFIFSLFCLGYFNVCIFYLCCID